MKFKIAFHDWNCIWCYFKFFYSIIKRSLILFENDFLSQPMIKKSDVGLRDFKWTYIYVYSEKGRSGYCDNTDINFISLIEIKIIFNSYHFQSEILPQKSAGICVCVCVLREAFEQDRVYWIDGEKLGERGERREEWGRWAPSCGGFKRDYRGEWGWVRLPFRLAKFSFDATRSSLLWPMMRGCQFRYGRW